MLSPSDIVPKGRTASIWSCDSGYGSNTREDEEGLQIKPDAHLDPAQSLSPSTQQPIGLGISGFWNVHVQDQLRLAARELTIDPVTTRLNVFTSRISSDSETVLSPETGNTCLTCELWQITSPGEKLQCVDCRAKDVKMSHSTTNDSSRAKIHVPRLEIPHESEAGPMIEFKASILDADNSMTSTTPPAGSDPSNTCSPNPKLLSPISPGHTPVKRSCARRSKKLPPHALSHLRAWLVVNRESPYPDAETKASLAETCGITEKQVTTWFTNARARKLSRFVSCPSSEDEGAYESDCGSMVSAGFSANGSSPFPFATPSTCATPASYYPATSAPGINTFDSTQPKTPISRRGKKKDYRRMSTASPLDEQPTSKLPISTTTATSSNVSRAAYQETWQCTFCHQHLVPKSWRRHEETQHRPKTHWTCLLTGPRIIVPSGSGSASICAFCGEQDPSDMHFATAHRISECALKSEAERTFLRPDHLRQHVRNFHRVDLVDGVRDEWRRDGPGRLDEERVWGCGFCGDELRGWATRQTHIAAHFKEGKTMAEWKTALVRRVEGAVEAAQEQDSMLARIGQTFGAPAIAMDDAYLERSAQPQQPQQQHFAQPGHFQPFNNYTTLPPSTNTQFPAFDPTYLPPQAMDPFQYPTNLDIPATNAYAINNTANYNYTMPFIAPHTSASFPQLNTFHSGTMPMDINCLPSTDLDFEGGVPLDFDMLNDLGAYDASWGAQGP